MPPTLMPTPLTPPSSSKQSPGASLEGQTTFWAVTISWVHTTQNLAAGAPFFAAKDGGADVTY